MPYAEGYPSALALSEDGGELAASSKSGKIDIFDTASGRRLVGFDSGLDPVEDIAVSARSAAIAVAGSSEIKIFDRARMKLIGGVKVADKYMRKLALSSPEKWREYASASKSVLALPETTWAEEMKKRGQAGRIGFSPGGKYAAYGFSMKIADIGSGRIYPVEGSSDERPDHMAFSADGKYLALIREFGLVQVAELSSGKILASFNWRENAPMTDPELARFKSPRGLHFLNGGKILAILSEAGNIELWDAFTGTKVRVLSPNSAPIYGIAVFPGKRRLVTMDGIGTLRVWSLENGDILETLPGPLYGWGGRVASSPDERYFLSMEEMTGKAFLHMLDPVEKVMEFPGWTRGRGKTKDGRFGIINFDPRARALKLFLLDAGAGGSIDSLGDIGNIHKLMENAWAVEEASPGENNWAFSPDGKHLAYARKGGSISIIELVSKKELKRLDGLNVLAWTVGYSADGKYLLGADISGRALIWDTKDWNVFSELAGLSHPGYNRSPGSPDDRYQVTPEAGQEPNPAGVIFNAQDAGGRETGKIEIQDKRRGRKIYIDCPGRPVLYFSRDSKYIAGVLDDSRVRVWDTASGALYADLTQVGSDVRYVAFGPGNDSVLFGGGDGAVRVYALPSGERLLTFVGFQDGEWLILDADGRYKSSASAERYMKMKGFSGKALAQELRKNWYAPDRVKAALAEWFGN
jgi:WD40 repeat protein